MSVVFSGDDTPAAVFVLLLAFVEPGVVLVVVLDGPTTAVGGRTRTKLVVVVVANPPSQEVSHNNLTKLFIVILGI